jgi:hypothetical protein
MFGLLLGDVDAIGVELGRGCRVSRSVRLALLRI